MQLSRRRVVAGLGLASLAAPVASRTQEPLDARSRFFRANLYLPEYLEQKAAYEAGDDSVLGALVQHASLVGDEALATRLRPRGQPLPDAVPLESAPAIATLVERARDARIVILNEAHHVSRHRHFAEQVLTALRAKRSDRSMATTAATPSTPRQSGPRSTSATGWKAMRTSASVIPKPTGANASTGGKRRRLTTSSPMCWSGIRARRSSSCAASTI